MDAVRIRMDNEMMGVVNVRRWARVITGGWPTAQPSARRCQPQAPEASQLLLPAHLPKMPPPPPPPSRLSIAAASSAALSPLRPDMNCRRRRRQRRRRGVSGSSVGSAHGNTLAMHVPPHAAWPGPPSPATLHPPPPPTHTHPHTPRPHTLTLPMLCAWAPSGASRLSSEALYCASPVVRLDISRCRAWPPPAASDRSERGRGRASGQVRRGCQARDRSHSKGHAPSATTTAAGTHPT